MDKSMVGHWLVALVACGTAYVAWSRPMLSEDEASVVVVAGSADRLTEVRWEDETHAVVVGREGEGALVTVTNKKANAATQEAASPAVALPGTEKALGVLSGMAPLKAARGLGKIEGERLAALGLDKPAATLTLRFGDTDKRVAIGNATYGSGSYYVQPEGGEVFLMAAASLAALKSGAPSLVDRNAVSATRDEVERVVVQGEGGTRELVHRKAHPHSHFADPADPETKLEQATTWVDRVMRLRVANVSAQEVTGEPKLTVSFYSGKKLLEELRIWEPGAEHAAVRSSRLKQAMTIPKNNVEPILRDVASMMAEGKTP